MWRSTGINVGSTLFRGVPSPGLVRRIRQGAKPVTNFLGIFYSTLHGLYGWPTITPVLAFGSRDVQVFGHLHDELDRDASFTLVCLAALVLFCQLVPPYKNWHYFEAEGANQGSSRILYRSALQCL